MSEHEDSEPQSVVILVAIEPRAYAQVIGTAIADLRPHFDVRIVEPENIDRQARSLSAGLVLCSRPKALSTDRGPCWVEYDPYAETPEEEIRINGIATEKRKVTLDDLLEILDQAVALE